MVRTIALVLLLALFREAQNGLEFMERITEYCPMEWRILSGDEEAIYGLMVLGRPVE